MTGTRVEHELRAAAGDGRSTRGRRASLAALALLLVVCIGLGSTTPLWDVGGPPRLADPDAYAGDLILVGLALLAVLPFAVPFLRRRRRRRDPEPEPELQPVRLPWWGRVLIALVIAATVYVALLLLSLLPGMDRGEQVDGNTQPAAPQPPAATPLTDDQGLPPVHWWGVVLLALIVAAAAAAAWSLREPRAEPEADETDDLLAAVEDSLDDLELEPDPRRAVIRAYARMERALGAHGLARRPSETPLEYLTRALTSLHVGRAAVERLTALFERAKFSPHAIDLSMKAEALAALGALRDELGGAAA